MSTLVLLRHGESIWNQKDLFTGWTDVDLTELGEQEARKGGRLLDEAGIHPAVLHTSVLKRAIRTAQIALEEMDRLWIPVKRHWRLNERHYGALQGLSKPETRERHGSQQYHLWRRGYATPPPPLEAGDERHPKFDPRYESLPPDVLPATECLKDVVIRMLPYWYDFLVPDLRAGWVVLVAAHGNSLRALIKHLDGISDDDIPDLNVPTGVPLVYDLDDDLQPRGERVAWAGGIRGRYLGEADEVRAKIEGVANQGAETAPDSR